MFYLNSLGYKLVAQTRMQPLSSLTIPCKLENTIKKFMQRRGEHVLALNPKIVTGDLRLVPLSRFCPKCEFTFLPFLPFLKPISCIYCTISSPTRHFSQQGD